jgi:hypothetical protein
MAFNLFPKKKKQSPQQELEIKKESVLKEIVLKYKSQHYTNEQIKNIFIDKGYPGEFVDYILHSVKKEVKNMAKKIGKEDEEEEDEEEEETSEPDVEEEEEDFDEEEDAPVLEPPKKLSPPQPQKAKAQAQTKVAPTQAPANAFDEWAQTMEQAITNLNLRINGIESALFRAGVIR